MKLQGWKEVLQACAELWEERQDFILWLTDDQKTELNASLNDLEYVMVQRIPFENYGYVMKNSHFSVCNLQGYATWNLAVMDSAVNGCFPIIRDTPLLRSLFEKLDKNDNDYFLFDSVAGLRFNMSIALGLQKTRLQSLIETHRITDHDDNTIEQTILQLVDEKLNSKIPAKYPIVKEFIETNGNTLKKTWVNKFWSFHANGNFSKIRLRLLSEGIKDNITNVETEYYT